MHLLKRKYKNCYLNVNDKIDHYNELYICDKILTTAKYNFLGVRMHNLTKSN